MEAIGNLDGVGCAAAGAFGVRFRAIAHDDLDARMRAPPDSERLSIPFGNQINGAAGLQIHEDSGVAVPAPQG